MCPNLVKKDDVCRHFLSAALGQSSSVSVTKKGWDGGRRKGKCLPDNLYVQLCISGGRRRAVGGAGQRREEQMHCRRERRRRRAYSYCSCPPVNKGLIGVRM